MTIEMNEIFLDSDHIFEIHLIQRKKESEESKIFAHLRFENGDERGELIMSSNHHANVKKFYKEIKAFLKILKQVNETEKTIRKNKKTSN